MRLLAIKEMVPAGCDVADVTLTVRSTAGLVEVSEAAASLKKGKEWEVELKRLPRRRSLSANAYAWVLLDKLAHKLGIPKNGSLPGACAAVWNIPGNQNENGSG